MEENSLSISCPELGLYTTDKLNFDLPTLAIFTGANLPLTRTLSEKFVENLKTSCTVIISAPNIKSLESHAHYLETKCYNPSKNTKAGSLKSTIEIHCATLDFNTNTESIVNVFNKYLISSKTYAYKQAIIFHNAGRITLSKRPEDFSAEEIGNYFRHNVTSSICLNNVFIDVMATHDIKSNLNTNSTCKCFVVNMSSPLAINPVQGLGLGCASKAAKEMYFKVIAIENPNISVLNYSPGPVKVETWQTLVDCSLNLKIKKEDILTPIPTKAMEEISYSSFLLIETKSTVENLIKLLESGSYFSGQHIEYVDKPKPKNISLERNISSNVFKGKLINSSIAKSDSFYIKKLHLPQNK
ncbi:unnamed protein product [Gordionus sp. m RMFG-2023]|uniref:sepiapterin reductase-like n=1 Tax=Gordionus sp. m RMFG-2023 TaxID=3053472 RepID=UPI0030DF184E